MEGIISPLRVGQYCRTGAEDVAVNVVYDERKFVEMVLYVAGKLRDDRRGGATKLNKVLYFADFAHVRKTGVPISGADYQKLAHGPAPRRLKPVRDRLVREGDAVVEPVEVLGYRRDVLVPRRPVDLSVFTAAELATIDEVLADLDGMTARQVSDLSHEEPGWRMAAEGETIPYLRAFVAKQQISTPTSRRLGEAAARRYGLRDR